MKCIFQSFVLLFLLCPSLWAQEYAYVTDSLQLRVYANPSTESKVLQSIDSGDSVEVFDSQDGFSKVITYDGTEGWVKTAFLVEEPPAKLLYYSVGEKNKQLEAEIEALKSSPPTASTPATTEADQNQIKELQTTLAEQQKLNESLKQQLENNSVVEISSSTPAVKSNDAKTNLLPQSVNNKTRWLLLLAAAAFVSLLMGMKISSWRLQKRFHGFRL